MIRSALPPHFGGERMFQYFLKRLLALLPKVLIITLLVFFGLEMIPGDAVTRAFPPDQLRSLTEAQIEALRESRGLNDPAPVRYVRWLGDLLRGDMGYSTVSGNAISDVLKTRLPATVELCGLALLISSVLGILLGCTSARHKNSLIDYFNTTLGILGTSVPDFFYGMCFIMLFALRLKWLPTGGRSGVGDTGLWGNLQYLIMPAFCLAIGLIAYLMRVTRNSMLDVMSRDYVKTARAKGESERVIFYKHCFRNGCTPVLILLISRFSFLVAGTTVIETVFNYPGMGLLLITAITGKDMSVAMMILLLVSLMVLFTSFLTDMITALMDPRVRFGKEDGT